MIVIKELLLSAVVRLKASRPEVLVGRPSPLKENDIEIRETSRVELQTLSWHFLALSLQRNNLMTPTNQFLNEDWPTEAQAVRRLGDAALLV